ncbi:hypothetical protein [Pontibacter chinhatensis]|uniref:Uncharacterized protein n=1 Tax=Pontibacter chinhatensis TaxID=1436961 RepID=A0A1I2QQD0_9BACT|nr:hypothetical protein [Pontibacter chinhatensis]SFG30805.1 hypothetical protein SAMN05421739_10293 [Pontibacter chinhatensis]
MRQNPNSFLFLILSLYGSLLMAVAALYLSDEYQPLVFLLRFSTFWFCSFLLAMLVFLYYTRRQIYTLSKAERSRVMRLSTYLVSGGVVMAIALASTLFWMGAV